MSADGFERGPVRAGDIEEAVALIRSVEAAHLGEAVDELTEHDLRDWLRGYDFEQDTRAVREAGSGALAAIGMVEARGDVLELDGYVRPDAAGNGLGSGLAAWAEDETRRRGLGLVRCGYLTRDAAADRLFRERGYDYIRSFYRMAIDLDAPPPAPTWPPGYVVSTRVEGEEGAFWEVVEGAFGEHWGHVQQPLVEWLERTGRASADPTLWYLVRAGGEPAAAAICAQRFGIGWIGHLGVLGAHRRLGLGRALLLHAFGELFARGERRMGLGVDATNETGAIALYEGVGMRVIAQADFRQRSLAS